MKRPGTASIFAMAMAAILGWVQAGQTCQADGKIHLLAIGDTFDTKIGRSVASDLDMMTGMFYAGNLPKELFRPTTISGEDCRPDAILRAIGQLPVEPDDAVVVFFSGHGAYDNQAGEYLKFPRLGAGVILKRTDLERAVRAKSSGARLGVLLTDSCNRLSILPRDPLAKAAPQAPGSMAPERLRVAALIRALFFDASGFVDLSSSKRGELSLCYPAVRYPGGFESHPGSLFTSALSSAFFRHKDDVLGWKEFADEAASIVRSEFQRLKPDGLDIEDEPEKPQMTQTLENRITVRAIRVTLRSTDRPVPPPYRPFPTARNHVSIGVYGFENRGRGIYVWATRPDSPAARLGLERGDVILSLDDATIRTAKGYHDATRQSDDEIYLTFQDVRTGQVRSSSVRLDHTWGAAPDDGRSQFGAAGVAAEGGGLLVQSVAPGSSSALVGVDPGDVILSVNGLTIASVEDFSRAVRESDDEIWFVVRNVRDGQLLGMVATLDRPRATFGPADFSLGVDGFENQGRGIYVWASHPGSPAARLGFERGDLILTVNGALVNTVHAYQQALQAAGGRAELTFQDVRTGQSRSVSTGLDRRGPTPGGQSATRFGASVAPAAGGGLLVQSIVPDSPAARVGVDLGDVIFSINGETLETEPDFRRAVQASPLEMRFEVRNVRNGQRLGMIARLDH